MQFFRNRRAAVQWCGVVVLIGIVCLVISAISRTKQISTAAQRLGPSALPVLQEADLLSHQNALYVRSRFPPLPVGLFSPFDTVIGLQIANTASRVSPLRMSRVVLDTEVFSNLEYLHLQGIRVNDDDLWAIGSDRLVRVNLNFTSTSDVGMQYIGKSSKSLREIQVAGTGITDQGIGCLAFADRLNVVNLNSTGITGESVELLSNLRHLRALFLAETRIDNSCIDWIVRLPELTELSLSRTGVTDEGVIGLGRCARLECLDLSGCQVSDASISAIVKIPNLNELRVYNTVITRSGVETLKSIRTDICVKW